MTIKIDKQIVDCAVISKQPETPESAAVADVVHMHEKLERPEILVGSTYKVKTPLSEHALYITINDIVLNQGTEHEQRRPFEIFINSKNMDHFQWVVALTRVISAVFRKGGDATFLVEELKGVFDPKGGYFKRGGRFMPSLVAEIGEAIENHMKSIGLLPQDKLDPHQKAFIAGKKQALADNDDPDSDYPASAQLCGKCYTKAVVYSDGCMTCLSCGDSKCS
ncbi:MAG: NrdJb [Halioglobus sp.]|nr:NrdJb [Halioglobus sp.]